MIISCQTNCCIVQSGRGRERERVKQAKPNCFQFSLFLKKLTTSNVPLTTVFTTGDTETWINKGDRQTSSSERKFVETFSVEFIEEMNNQDCRLVHMATRCSCYVNMILCYHGNIEWEIYGVAMATWFCVTMETCLYCQSIGGVFVVMVSQQDYNSFSSRCFGQFATSEGTLTSSNSYIISSPLTRVYAYSKNSTTINWLLIDC